MFINNPVSGRQKGKRLERKIRRILEEKYIVDVYRTGYKGSATDIAAHYGRGYDVVAVAGGDGTVNEAVEGLLKIEKEKRPAVMVIPAGTSNFLAEVLNEPADDIIETAQFNLKTTPHPFDVGFINGLNFLMAISFGAFTDTTYKTPQEVKNTFGFPAYIIGAVKSLSELRSFSIKVTHDGESFEGEYILGSITSCYAVGGIIRLDESIVKTDDGKFECVFVKKPDGAAGWGKIISLILEKKFDQDTMIFFQTDRLRIDIDEKIPWTIDGDYRGDFGSVDIWLSAGEIRVMKTDDAVHKPRNMMAQ